MIPQPALQTLSASYLGSTMFLALGMLSLVAAWRDSETRAGDADTWSYKGNIGLSPTRKWSLTRTWPAATLMVNIQPPEPHQALSLWSGSTDSKTLDYQRTNPREYQIVRTQHKAIGNPVWPSFPKWLLSCGKFSSCLPESFFLVSFEGSSSLAQSINAPASTLGPFLLFCLALSCPRGFHSNSSFISI